MLCVLEYAAGASHARICRWFTAGSLGVGMFGVVMPTAWYVATMVLNGFVRGTGTGLQHRLYDVIGCPDVALLITSAAGVLLGASAWALREHGRWAQWGLLINAVAFLLALLQWSGMDCCWLL